ncbi:broad-complex core protein isoforms 1/2/3/4/5 [Anopheles funestus]|uniref:broad-complex core protein isoforms 1/2/3/4/5 n=1 Tax=Anopheles funestus TaxID=62324 RepID=UPI0020C65FAE|nr:broad-complex core protein isoforms 1/2/3/4/5 [Anopheles funestus]XP_049285704.1 broad-complex core protein isoforms 1/2/3/4/5 [Anopheles funestus]XP_049285705.1 broad-complex core protein isoforms 1/2/3/4/5 [Anopheles funestus]XP_049285706.1 broad-complex core protein isoforms 1/2/3/4/5 [Anopheles funestus]XP_049285707.1 broad-complex core protein isoforms 1/2/3/4/5 [Anopheles funestus]XP_049285708.1 broad-complex core protein isoforms 1/2/3/4/5 [Anopheles funestus]XP_049285709.1 broad-co
MDAASTHPLGGRPGSCTGGGVGSGGGGGGGGGRMPGGAAGSSSPQQFCLRWHNHQASLLSSLPLLLDQSHLTDVTLMAEGQKIKAHRVVLSACSTFFSELFRTLDGAQYPVVVLPGASYHAVAALITFMYSGEVNVYEAQISVLLSLAETLGIKGLADFNSNPNKSSTPSTEASSSRDSDVPSPYHSMKVSSPVDNFFARPYAFGSDMFEMRNNAQALNLITNAGGSNGGSNGGASGANHHNDGYSGNSTSTANACNTIAGNLSSKSLTSSELYARFEAERNEQLSAEALCKMNELNLHAENAMLKEKQHHLNRSSTPIRSAYAHQQHQPSAGESRTIVDSPMFGNFGNDNTRDCKLPNGPLLLGSLKLKEEDISDSIHQLNHSYGSVPSTPTPQTPGLEDAGRVTQTTTTRKTLNAHDTATNKRKKLEQITENLLETLKQSSEGSKLPLHLFNKPPTVTPVSNTQNPYLAHHFLTNESASKTPENFSLESSHPNAASNTNTRASPIATATSIGTASSPTTTTPGSLLALAPSPGSANENLIKTLHITHPSQIVALQQQQQQSPQQPSTQKPPSSKLYATCGICNKQLSNQYNLRVHLETHQNVRYACQVCPHVSRSKDALRKHVSYRHPGAPSPCDPDTKRKRSKGTTYSQLAKQQDGLAEQQAAAILNHQQQQQQQQASNLLANLTSQSSLPSLLQTFAAHHKSPALLFNQTASVAALAQSATCSTTTTTAMEAAGSPCNVPSGGIKREPTASEPGEPKPEGKSNEPKTDDPTATKQSDKDI